MYHRKHIARARHVHRVLCAGDPAVDKAFHRPLSLSRLRYMKRDEIIYVQRGLVK